MIHKSYYFGDKMKILNGEEHTLESAMQFSELSRSLDSVSHGGDRNIGDDLDNEEAIKYMHGHADEIFGRVGSIVERTIVDFDK